MGEWIRGLGFSSTNPVGTRGVLDVCLCCGGGVSGDWVGGSDWKGGVMLSWIICVDGRSMHLYIVLGGYHVYQVFNHVAPYQYLLPTVYLFMAYIANLDLFVSY